MLSKRNRTLIFVVLAGSLGLVVFIGNLFSSDAKIGRNLPNITSISREKSNDQNVDVQKNLARKMQRRPAGSDLSHYAKRPVSATSVETLAKMREDLKLRPRYRLVDDDGRLTFQAAEDLKLTDKEKAAVQKCYDELQYKMLDLLKGNTQRLHDLELGNVVEAYRMQPFPVDGEASFSAFLDKIDNVIGAERSWDLAKSIPVEGLAGQFGAKEILIKVIEPPSNILTSQKISRESLAELYVVEQEIRDPSSGKVISKTSSYVRHADRSLFNFLSRN